MKTKKIILIPMLTAFFLLLSGCKYDLVSSPTSSGSFTKNPADYPNSIKAPASLTASKGGYKSVTLSWAKVDNAVQYAVYSAYTPFDTFAQVYLTEGAETSCSIDEESGCTKYYCVSAINYYGTNSVKSKIVKGTSLSRPTITSITPYTEGDSVKIEWWMDNQNSYQDKVIYNIYTYSDKGKTKVPGTDLCFRGTDLNGDLCATVYGLSPSTDYYFVVEAAIEGVEQKTEKCEPTSASTSHRIIPDMAGNFSVSQGTSTDKILISWTLPAPVDYFDSYTNTYSQNPVYFKLYRKPSDQNDSAYIEIAKIGSHTTSSWTVTDNASVHFKCSSETGESPLTVSKNGEQLPMDAPYDEYIPYSTITYTDSLTAADRGSKFTYKLQSFTDNTKKLYSSNSSVTPALEGWTLGTPSLSSDSVIVADENTNKITSVQVSFKFNFDSKNKNYTYLLTTQQTDVAANNVSTIHSPEVLLNTNNISEINTFVLSFGNDTSDYKTIPESSVKTSYFTFKIFILPATDTNYSTEPAASEYIDFYPAAGKTTVTDDLSKIPVIENFTVEDGYASKFKLSWKDQGYGADAIYTVRWINIGKNDVESSVQEKILSASDYSTVSGNIVFNHEANSGERRKYTLEVNTGIVETKTLDTVYETLGTPELNFDTPDYSSISVSWKKVQKANTNYTVSAKYVSQAISSSELSTNDNTTLTDYAAETEDYSCRILQPFGFDNKAISGNQIKLEITATNTERSTDNKVTSSILVYTLGPALLKTSASAVPTSSNSISINWDKINGASEYLVYRVFYKNNSANKIETTDTLIVDAETLQVKEYNGQETDNRTTVKLIGSKYILTDKQQTDENGYGYQTNQGKIQWGLPFGYVVLPLKKDGTKNDFKFMENSLTLDNSSLVNYGSFTPVKTATYGYGLNVKASKAEKASSVLVEWTAPFYSNLTPTIYRKNLYPEEGTTATWKVVATVGQGLTSYQVPVPRSEAGEVYEYAVQYESGNSGNLVPSYIELLESTLESTTEKERRYIYPDGVTPEQLNKGYVLALEGLNAIYGGKGTTSTNVSYYQENINWEKWDYSKRALGPDNFTIEIKNNNKGEGRTKLAKVNILNQEENLVPYTSADDVNLADTTVSSSSTGLTVKPTGLSNGTSTTTDGVLQVLRDAKHYYSVYLTASHKVKIQNENEQIVQIKQRQASDDSVYAYRQVSDAELSRMALFLFAYGFYINDKGTENYSNVNTHFSYCWSDTNGKNHYLYGLDGGYAIFTDRSRAYDIGLGKYKQYYTYTNYAASLYTPSGIYVESPVKISCEKKSCGIQGNSDNYIYMIRDVHDISIANYDTKIDSSIVDYSATLNISCKDSKSLILSIKRGNATEYSTVIDTTELSKQNNESDSDLNLRKLNTRRFYFPMQLYDADTHYYVKDTAAFWWPSTLITSEEKTDD